MWSLLFLPLLFFSEVNSAGVGHIHYVTHEARTMASPKDVKEAISNFKQTFPLRFSLKERNLHLLTDHLLSVSDPSSPLYGKHWSPDQVIKAFSPSQADVKLVEDWLTGRGLHPSRVRRSLDQSSVVVENTTLSEAEELLKSQFHVVKRDDEGEYIASDSYSLPESISAVVDFVTPGVHPVLIRGKTLIGVFKRTVEQQRVLRRDLSATSLGSCSEVITPDCVKALYNMTYVPRATGNNSVGIASYYPLTYLQSDLDAFFRNFSPTLVGSSPKLVSIDGGSIEVDEQTDVGEDGWILQYLMSLVQPQPVTLLQTGNQQTGATRSFNLWLDAVDGNYCTSGGGDDFTYDPQIPSPYPDGIKEHSCGITKSPHVVSNSQGAYEHAFSNYYLERQCNEFAKLGLMGVTVLYSAGNTGTAGVGSGVCRDEHGTMNYNGTKFVPTWPASCPWVTAVGGTQVKPNSTAAPGAEEVWSQPALPGVYLSGGGGFSNTFSTPSYQKAAVAKYLREFNLTRSAKFNVAGRAYPDLSANANAFLNVDDGQVITSSGTSGATPTVAAIITLVNDARIAAGKSPVGFINPVIYSPSFSRAFNDITSGANQGCRGLLGEGDGGFHATKGWDPASGVGSPNLGLLIDAWLKLP